FDYMQISKESARLMINTEKEMDMLILAKKKFAKVIYQMENTILLSSSEVKFSSPYILMHLRNKEIEICFHINKDDTFKSFVIKDALDLANNFSNRTTFTKNSTGKYHTYVAITKSNQVLQDF
ncbi:3658_t:CDS:1, partial [Funneliformis caledonium]